MSGFRWAVIAFAIVAGVFMSEFYEWSGEDQSRPAPIVRWLALGMLVFDLGVFGWLAWHYRQSLRLSLSESPLESQALSDDNPWKRFSIRHVLWGTTAIALIIAAQLYTKLPLALGALLVVVCYAAWVAYQRPRLRMQVVALLVCLWAPFLWIAGWPEIRSNMLAMVLALPGMPGLLPAGIVSFWTGQNMGSESSLPALLTTMALLMGLWMIYHGPHRALAYTLGVLTASLFSSFALQALLRM